MAQIFISYRRAETEAISKKIHDALIPKYGDEAVFLDTEDIGTGAKWKSVLRRHVVSSDAVLVVMGSEWLTIKDSNASEDDPPRIFKNDDIVRWEVQTALDMGDKLIIPVLVNGAGMPRQDQLPDDIRSLCDHNAITIRTDPDQEKSDIASLVASMVADAPPESRGNRVRLFISVATFLLALLAVLANITGILDFFGISSTNFFPESTEALTVQRQVTVNVEGDCISLDELSSALQSQVDNNEAYTDVIVGVSDAPNTALGYIDIVVDCGNSQTEISYIPIGVLLGLWEADSISLATSDVDPIVSLTILLLDYLPLETRPTTTQDFGSLVRELPVVETSITEFEAIGKQCILDSSPTPELMSITEAQVTLLRGNSYLFSASRNKYELAEGLYRQVMLQSPEYSALAQINLAYSMLNRIVDLRDDTLDSDPETQLLDLEAEITCLLQSLIDAEDADYAYYASITQAMAYAYTNRTLAGASHFPTYTVDELFEIDRNNLMLEACNNAKALVTQVPDEQHYLADYCLGIVNAYTLLQQYEAPPLAEISESLHLGMEQSPQESNLVDVTFWQTYLVSKRIEARLDTTGDCLVYQDAFNTRLGDVIRITSDTVASPLPELLQLLTFTANVYISCEA